MKKSVGMGIGGKDGGSDSEKRCWGWAKREKSNEKKQQSSSTNTRVKRKKNNYCQPIQVCVTR